MDDIERAIEDGVNGFKSMAKDGRFVPGAGAAEIDVANKVQLFLILHELLRKFLYDTNAYIDQSHR